MYKWHPISDRIFLAPKRGVRFAMRFVGPNRSGPSRGRPGAARNDFGWAGPIKTEVNGAPCFRQENFRFEPGCPFGRGFYQFSAPGVVLGFARCRSGRGPGSSFGNLDRLKTHQTDPPSSALVAGGCRRGSRRGLGLVAREGSAFYGVKAGVAREGSAFCGVKAGAPGRDQPFMV